MVNIPTRAKLKMASGSQVSDAQGVISLPLKIPGTPGENSRIIAGGSGWFDDPAAGDRFTGVEIKDIDNIIVGGYMFAGMSQPDALAKAIENYPNYPVVGQFHEEAVTAPMVQGWYMNPTHPTDVQSIGGEEDLASGLYLNFLAQKATAVVDTFRVNIFWGDPDE